METVNAPAYFKSNTGYRFISQGERGFKITIPKPDGGRPQMTLKRNVLPKDDIPESWLTSEAIKVRVSTARSGEISNKGQHHLRSALKAFSGGSITAPLMAKFYRHVDAYVKHDVKPNAICAKGCNQCCHLDKVDVSLPEANYIAEMTGTALKPKHVRSEFVQDRPCLFLKEGSCSIYPYRPLACRLFHALDHWKHCYAGESHHIYTLMSQQNLAELHLEMMKCEHPPFEDGKRNLRDWFETEEQHGQD